MFSAAKALAELARKHSVDVTFDSPYSMEARSRVRNKYIFHVSPVILTCFFNDLFSEKIYDITRFIPVTLFLEKYSGYLHAGF